MSELSVQFHTEEDGNTRAELLLDGHSASRLWIVPFTIRIGAALVRMDGIGGVGTDEEYRNRGLSRRVLEASVDRMRDGDAALSMLYGIPDLYPKFGFATAGPDHLIYLRLLQAPADLPVGWLARPIAPGDLPAVRRLYEGAAATAVGAAVRSPERRAWKNLEAVADGSSTDTCRVIQDPEGAVRAYAWRAEGHWYSRLLAKEDPQVFIVAEVIADGPASADAVLADLPLMAAGIESDTPPKDVLLGLPPEGAVAAAAMRQSARVVSRWSRCGGSMARVLNAHRLIGALRPELEARLRFARSTFNGRLRIETDEGGACLDIDRGHVILLPGPESAWGAEPGATLELRLPQYELARLALGAFPPHDVLDRLERPPARAARELAAVLFPVRRPHMYLPDRF